MNEELVLHIINTACYGLNLHFSLVPQPPYLYVFFDRSPEAALNYSTLTETIRLAAVSAGLPPEYEYLPYRDWETDRKSTRLNSSHSRASRMPSSA